MFDGDQAERCTSSASTSTSTSTRTTCTSPARSSARSSGCASWATSTSRTARSGCATDGVRRRQGPRAHQVRRRRPAYISGDLAYYLDKRERGFDRCVIMLGADHHGYVGRLMAMCAGVRRRPRREPRAADRPAGQPAQGRRAGADEQARRHRRHARGPRRGDRRRRGPLRAGALLAATRRSTSTSTCGPRRPATTRSSTCSTPTRALSRSAQRRRPRDRRSPERRSTRRCWTHEQEGELLRALGGVPAGRRARRRAARAAPGRALPRGARPSRSTSSTTRAGCCPRATRRSEPCTAARLMLVAATRTVLANGLGLLGVTAPERM